MRHIGRMTPLSRRDFLATVGAAAATAPFLACARTAQSIVSQAGKANLDILVLGGTGFIGPHLVRYAVGRGHRVTIFTRGRHDAELPNEVVRLQGDRNGQLDSLKDKRW